MRRGVPASPSGLRPCGAEPQDASQAKPLVPNAEHTDFVCAICQRTVCMRWNFAKRDKIIPPICNYCEGHYSSGYGASVKAGSFRDRREVTRGLALSESLRCEAMHQQWSAKYVA